MSKATKMAAAAAAAAKNAKKTDNTKTTSKSESDYLSTAPSVCPVSKSYGLGTNNKFAISYDTKGTTNFILISFYVNGALPEKGGYLATLLEDNYTVRWSHPIDSYLFTMEHLHSIMGSKYSESNVQVCSFDKVTQALYKDKINPDTNKNYWGKPQKIHLKKKCTGKPESMAMPYKAPSPLEPLTNARGCQHYQFHMIVQVKVQLVDKHLTSKKKTKTKLIDLYKVASSQNSTPSSGDCCSSKKRNWGGSHHETSHGSSVSQDAKESDKLEEY
jgi:hypothetical protein